jgi:protein-L-isoaspartate(D-aspartate) O-methyltransferase
MPAHGSAQVVVDAAALRSRMVEALNLDPTWRAVFERVPRHVFVPGFVACWPPEDKGSDGRVLVDPDSDPGRWLDLVYSDRLLIIVDDGERRSSSSSPSAMARFLELLDVQDGNTVLEVGTGSGYNAALLCERLGSRQVISIDIDPDLVEVAQKRLAECAYTPTLAIADGWDGYPSRAPYDRIIATCSVPRIPEAWIDQLQIGGVIVTPLSGGRFDPSGLVALRRAADGSLSGRLDRGGAAFMPMRVGRSAPVEPRPSTTRADLLTLAESPEGEPRPCTVPPYMLDVGEPSMPPHFLLRLDETMTWEWCWLDGPGGEPRAPAVAAPDGSWARVVMRSRPIVHQGGPRRLWDMVERNWERYLHLGRPAMDRYGITVAPDRRQHVWLDSPESEHRWEL